MSERDHETVRVEQSKMRRGLAMVEEDYRRGANDAAGYYYWRDFFLSQLNGLERERRDLLGLPQERPKRWMPSWKKIVAHHAEYGHLDPSTPECWRCGGRAEKWEHLIRAHIIDRVYGGLDAAQNLAPLCELCHRLQPGFEAGDEDAARAWFYVGASAPGAAEAG